MQAKRSHAVSRCVGRLDVRSPRPIGDSHGSGSPRPELSLSGHSRPNPPLRTCPGPAGSRASHCRIQALSMPISRCLWAWPIRSSSCGVEMNWLRALAAPRPAETGSPRRAILIWHSQWLPPTPAKNVADPSIWAVAVPGVPGEPSAQAASSRTTVNQKGAKARRIIRTG